MGFNDYQRKPKNSKYNFIILPIRRKKPVPSKARTSEASEKLYGKLY